MKKFIYALSIFTLAGIVSANAQEQGAIRVNGGFVYGTEAGYDGGGIGINLGGEYFVTDEISIAPSYDYFFKSEETFFGQTVSVQIGSLNLDGRYYFMNEDIQVYGLAGLSFLSAKVKVPNGFGAGGTTTVTDNETGLNIGGGVVFPLSDGISINGQLKYQTPGDGQLVLGAGVVFAIN